MMSYPSDSVILNIWFWCEEIQLPGKREFWQPTGSYTTFLMRLKGYPKHFYVCPEALQRMKEDVLVRLLSQPLFGFVHRGPWNIKADRINIRYEVPGSGWIEFNSADLTDNVPPALHSRMSHCSEDDDYPFDDQFLSVNFSLCYFLKLIWPISEESSSVSFALYSPSFDCVFGMTKYTWLGALDCVFVFWIGYKISPRVLTSVSLCGSSGKNGRSHSRLFGFVTHQKYQNFKMARLLQST
jgi:hypothetical protein